MSGAFPLQAARPWGRSRALLPVFSDARGVGVKTLHRLNSVPSCELALRAVGVAEGVPGGDASRRCKKRRKSGACPPPAARPPGGQSWSAAHVLWARVCGHGGLALSLWRACPAGGLRAAGVAGGRPSGVTSYRFEGSLVSGAFPLSAARPWGRGQAPSPLFPGRGWRRRGDQAPAPQRALL